MNYIKLYSGGGDTSVSPFYKNASKNEIKKIQEALNAYNGNYQPLQVDGIMGPETVKAIKAFQKNERLTVNGIVDEQTLEALTKQSINSNSFTPQSGQQVRQFTKNFLKNPVNGITDLVLSTADKMGAPTNVINYLRDLNVNIPYRISSAIRAGFNTIVKGGDFSKNYEAALANPSWYEQTYTINPLPVTNSNFSEDELQVIKDMENGKGYIDVASLKRVSPDNKYGNKGSIQSYFTPVKVVQSAIGQASGDKEQRYITDVFDVNTQSNTAKQDNANYIKLAHENPGLNYQTIRATMPYLNSIDIMPDEYKIQTKIDLK